MTNVLLYSYYYRYREKRKQIKNIVDTLDYQTAKTQLDAAIAEHFSIYGNTPEQKKDFNYGERIAMNHAQRHLQAVINQNDPSFLIQAEDDSTTIIGHHSDIVKQALLHIPKIDYSEQEGG